MKCHFEINALHSGYIVRMSKIVLDQVVTVETHALTTKREMCAFIEEVALKDEK